MVVLTQYINNISHCSVSGARLELSLKQKKKKLLYFLSLKTCYSAKTPACWLLDGTTIEFYTFHSFRCTTHILMATMLITKN